MALTKNMVQEQMAKGALVINVLDLKAFADLHIKGSVNVPLKGKSDEEFAKEVGKLVTKDRMVITHCTNVNCGLGPRAAQILKARGFAAEDYPGGIEEWFYSGLPVDGKMPAAHS